jgi:hypothetical protein
MPLLERFSVSLGACQLMAATAIPPARATAPTHIQFTRQEPASLVVGTRSPSTASALSQFDRALDPVIDLTGFQQRSSLVAGRGRRGRKQ